VESPAPRLHPKVVVVKSDTDRRRMVLRNTSLEMDVIEEKDSFITELERTGR
jgi:hypothetical protein